MRWLLRRRVARHRTKQRRRHRGLAPAADAAVIAAIATPPNGAGCRYASTMSLSAAQVQSLVIADRGRLGFDLFQHLMKVRPDLADASPGPYLQWVVDDSIDLASPFELGDVFALRVFLRLRFDV